MELANAVNQGAKNPLFEDIILNNIFKYLNINGVTRCRRVCPKWEEIATPILADKIDSVQIKFDGEKMLKIVQFVSMIRGSALRFTNFSFLNVPVKNNRIIDSFFQECGQSITKLKLNYPDSDSNSKITSAELRTILLKKAPNLTDLEIAYLPLGMNCARIFSSNDHEPKLKVKKLTLHITAGDWDEYQGNGMLFLNNLFKSSPDLQELIIESKSMNVDYGGDTSMILDSLVLNQRVQNLTALNLGPVDSSEVKTLATKFNVAQLKRFKCFSLTRINWNDFASFLDSQKNSLEFLSFNIGQPTYEEEECKLNLPIFPKLKSLDIFFERLMPADEPIHLSPINYGILFPKLEKLVLHGQGEASRESYWDDRISFSLDELFPFDSEPCPFVTDLTLPEDLNSGETMEIISKIFPNVVILDLGRQAKGGAGIIEAVWVGWPNTLQELSVYMMSPKEGQVGIYSNDSLFTGFPEDACEIVEMAIQKFEKNPSGSSSNINIEQLAKLKTKPSIANLKKLRILSINEFCPEPFDECDYYDEYDEDEDTEPKSKTEPGPDPKPEEVIIPPSLLSSVTGYFGLLELKELVELTVMEKHKISKIFVDKLSEELGLRFTTHREDFIWLRKFPG